MFHSQQRSTMEEYTICSGSEHIRSEMETSATMNSSSLSPGNAFGRLNSNLRVGYSMTSLSVLFVDTGGPCLKK